MENKKVRMLIISIFVIVSGIFAQTNLSMLQIEESTPAVIAVKFHADWCGSCKAMGPVFEELQAKYDVQPVLYITLDYTHNFDRHQSKYLATTLGLEKIWADNGGKTGFILLINGHTKEVMETLTRSHNLKQMGTILIDTVDKVLSDT